MQQTCLYVCARERGVREQRLLIDLFFRLFSWISDEGRDEKVFNDATWEFCFASSPERTSTIYCHIHWHNPVTCNSSVYFTQSHGPVPLTCLAHSFLSECLAFLLSLYFLGFRDNALCQSVTPHCIWGRSQVVASGPLEEDVDRLKTGVVIQLEPRNGQHSAACHQHYSSGSRHPGGTLIFGSN